MYGLELIKMRVHFYTPTINVSRVWTFCTHSSPMGISTVDSTQSTFDWHIKSWIRSVPAWEDSTVCASDVLLVLASHPIPEGFSAADFWEVAVETRSWEIPAAKAEFCSHISAFKPESYCEGNHCERRKDSAKWHLTVGIHRDGPLCLWHLRQNIQKASPMVVTV